jgi:hydrogenase expression/formation protein HypE
MAAPANESWRQPEPMNVIKRRYPRPLDLRHGRVDLTHGSGGRAMAQLIEELFEAHFDNPWLAERNDQACFE